MLVAKKNYYYDIDENFKVDLNRNIGNDKKINKKTKKNAIKKVNAVFCILLISLILFVVLYRYTYISEIKYRIHTLNKQIKELEVELQNLKAEFDRVTRSDIIEQKAIKDLKMQYPQYSQIVFLTIKDDNLDLSNTEKKNIDTELYGKDMQNFKKYSYLKKYFKKLYSLLD